MYALDIRSSCVNESVVCQALAIHGFSKVNTGVELLVDTIVTGIIMALFITNQRRSWTQIHLSALESFCKGPKPPMF